MKKIVIASITVIIITIIVVSLSIGKPSTNSTFQPPSVTPNSTLPTVVLSPSNATLPTTPRHLNLSLDEKMNFKVG